MASLCLRSVASCAAAVWRPSTGASPPMAAVRAVVGAALQLRTPSAVLHPSALTAQQHVRWATSKAGGSTKNGRDSNPKFLGVKVYGGARVEPGNIIIRQRGSLYAPVRGTSTVRMGKDYTIYAVKPGVVKFWWHAVKKKYFVEVLALPDDAAATMTGQRPTPVKYPITFVREHELLSLLRLPPDTVIADSVLDRLLAKLRSMPAAEARALVPAGAKLVGDVAAKYHAASAAMAPHVAVAFVASAAPTASAGAAP